MRTIKKQIMIFSSVAIVLATTLLFVAFGIPSGNAVSTVIGPRFWPFTLLVILLVLSVLSVILTRFDKGVTEVSEEEEILTKLEIEDEGLLVAIQQDGAQDEADEKNKRHWYLILLIALYAIMMGYIGFLIATAIFIFGCAMLLGLKNKRHLVLTSLVGSGIVFLLFSYLLKIPLP